MLRITSQRVECRAYIPACEEQHTFLLTAADIMEHVRWRCVAKGVVKGYRLEDHASREAKF
eukprot:6198058-Pleurochrysis_carterae.AAC.4